MLAVLFVNTLQSTCLLRDLMIFGVGISSFKAQGFWALCITCMVLVQVIKNCFLVKLKHRAKKGFFT